MLIKDFLYLVKRTSLPEQKSENQILRITNRMKYLEPNKPEEI